jgi:tetratricopeptide (TPR) repeat protein
MGVQVRERTIEEIEGKLGEMRTVLNKIGYLESAVRVPGFSFEIKRFLWAELFELYKERKMFEKAARAMSNKAGIEVVFRDKVESYLSAAELFAKAGRIDDAEEMFVRASRDTNNAEKMKIKLARKNIYFVLAKDLEAKGKRKGAVKFYEKLIKMNLDSVEKDEIKEKLISMYKALGLFREAKLLGNI